MGYDEKGKLYDPPFTEQEISNFCGCVASTLADVLTKEEYEYVSRFRLKHPELVQARMSEKSKCIAGEKCKKYLNLAYPELFSAEPCRKG